MILANTSTQFRVEDASGQNFFLSTNGSGDTCVVATTEGNSGHVVILTAEERKALLDFLIATTEG